MILLTFPSEWQCLCVSIKHTVSLSLYIYRERDLYYIFTYTHTHTHTHTWASQVELVVKNPPTNAGGLRDAGLKKKKKRDAGLIPRSGRSPGEGHGNPLQCCCLENPMDRGARWATVHGVTKSQTWLKRLSMHTCMHIYTYIYYYYIWNLYVIDFAYNVEEIPVGI